MNNLLLSMGYLSWIPVIMGIYYTYAHKNLITGIFAIGICIINLVAVSLDSIEIWLTGMFALSAITFCVVVFLIFTRNESEQTGNEETTKIPGAIA